MAMLTDTQISDFKAQIRGEIVLPDDPAYDQVRQIWNAMIDRRPAAIVRCAGAADIRNAIAFARDHDLLLAIRGAGHNIAGNAVCDDGLMIDLSQMRSVRIDPGARRAYVEPGAILGDLDHEAQAFGLVTPLGINSTTGVAGLTLGGGFGWLSRKYGLTVDNLLSVDMVTASGELVHTSATEKPELFWALRGGGGNFGVVTLFEFQLHPLGHDILAGLIVFPGEQADAVLSQYRDYVANLPEETNIWVVLRKAPPLPFLPEEVHGREVVVLAIFHAGDHQQGQAQIEPLRHFGEPHGEHIGVMPYCAWQQAFDPLLTPGARNYWKSHNFTELSDKALATIVDYSGQLPSEQTEMFIGLLGGEISRIDSDATAYRQRDAQFVLNVHARWEDPSEDQHCVDWAREFFTATAPFATGGVYVNFMTEEETERIAAAYGDGYQRLVAVKNQYDPGNLFRLNQNIKPTD
ncbi:FAD-binding oxidoreductase [Malonomonas rubra]|uniref:FAD-binding oxidoreductase n=1 Tax=Malonomonas rubra TaxID=57040 RepID=UPI0026EE053F|nr:FAD-binding oxidoreductase [Malonomonas rubra]